MTGSGADDLCGRILIVADDPSVREALVAALEGAGHELLDAENAQYAVELFDSLQPDLILLDITNPGSNGLSAAHEIRKRDGGRSVPMVLLDEELNDQVLDRYLEIRAREILTKPVKPRVLQACISILLQEIRERRVLLGENELLHRQLARAARDQELACRACQVPVREAHDQELAKRIFSRIAHLGCLDEAGIDYIASSLMLFNGDMLLAEYAPSGALYVMLGDFTGHGLSAAVGSLPAAETFYGMTRKGFHVSEIAKEINNKLHRILPKGVFCAAALGVLDSAQHQLTIWNGGLPPGILHGGASGVIKDVIESSHLPLGVLPPEQFDSRALTLSIEKGDYLLLFSDGVVEAENERGELYGEHRVRACVQGAQGNGGAFQRVVAELDEFRGKACQSDDLTLIELPGQFEPGRRHSEETSRQRVKPAKTWDMNLQLGTDTLRDTDPVPLLLQMLNEIQGLQPHREELFTVLTELYSNALDHGVLGLDSSLKHNAQGFAEYFALRQQRLETLEEGSIYIRFQHYPMHGGGRLVITMRDSGEGFDHNTQQLPSGNHTGASGRGILLVKSICSELQYKENGQVAVATLDWSE